jgi:endoribonuclease Dicer
MTPSSAFPDDNFTSFNEYFLKKYQLHINDQQQPLLDVDYTTHRLNLLTARVPPRRMLHMRQLTHGQIQKQLLIPELVAVHPVPASLWHQLVLLPSLLYRLNGLLLADELRARVLADAFASGDTLPPANFWSPLVYPTHYEPVSHADVETLSTSSILSSSSKNKKRTKKKRADGGKAANEDAVHQNGQQCVDVPDVVPLETAASGDNELEIGVWDPNEAVALLGHNPLDPPAIFAQRLAGKRARTCM